MLALKNPMLRSFKSNILTETENEDTWSIMADWLEDNENTFESIKVRKLIKAKEIAKSHKVKKSHTDIDIFKMKGTIKTTNHNLLRLWAVLCVQLCPLANGKTVWTLLSDNKSKIAVTTSELFWCGLANENELRLAYTKASRAAGTGNDDFADDAANAVYYAANAALDATAVAIHISTGYAISYATSAAAYSCDGIIDRQKPKIWCVSLARQLLKQFKD